MNENELKEKIKKGIDIIRKEYADKNLKDYHLLDELEKNFDDANKLVEIYRESGYPNRDENEIRWNSIFDQIVYDHAETFWQPFHDLEEILRPDKK